MIYLLSCPVLVNCIATERQRMQLGLHTVLIPKQTLEEFPHI